MSNRTKLKLQNLQVYLKKNVFSGRYIVRNILAMTVLITVFAAVYGVGSLAKDNKNNNEEPVASVDAVAVEETYAINISDTSKLNASSINILMADMDAGNDVDIEAKETEMLTEAYKEFENKCVAITDNINVRQKADTDSQIVGKMNNGAVAVINSNEGEWLNITSGDVTGYVKAEFVKTGNEAYDYAKDYYSIIGTVTEDGVNVRKEATTDSEVIAAAYTGVTYKVDEASTEAVDDWVCILIDSSNKGYVSADYMEITEGYPEAVAYNEVSSDNKESSSKTKSDNNKTDDNSVKEDTSKKETTTEEKTTEEKTTEAVTTEEATTEAEVDNQTTVTVTARGSFGLSEEDINLMAAVMTLECGNESYEGQLAVANVILNRLQSGRWGNTISDVVYAPSQFTVVNLSSFNTYISPSCLQAAREACAGTNNIGGYMSFRPVSNVNTSNLGSYTIIGNHCFF